MGDAPPKIDDKKEGGAKDPPPPQPPPPRDARKPQSVHEKKTAALIFELNLRLEDADKKLTASDMLTEKELRDMVARIQQNQDRLSGSLVPIASDDPMMAQAFALVEKAKVTIARLESIERALSAKQQTADSRASGDMDKEQIFQAASAKHPVGYCDGPGKGDADHCGLPTEERTTYRNTIRDFVHTTTTSWLGAINAKNVEELLAKEKTSFEQKLGELLLGLLFKGFESAAKYGIKAGTKKVTKALTKETSDPDLAGYGLMEAPDETVVDVTKTVVEKGASKGLDMVKESGKGHKTAQQVSDEARVAVPADRKAFLQVMKAAPTTWSNSILGNLDNLYDEDLAALAAGLPAEAPSQPDFEAKIESLLKRFEDQVLAVNHANRPISIVGPRGKIRHALVTPDMRMDPNLHGDARNLFAPTGKTRFLGWIDDDMVDMANAHKREQNQWTMPETQRFDDPEFWDADSLSRLTSFGAKQPEPDQLVRNRPTT